MLLSLNGKKGANTMAIYAQVVNSIVNLIGGEEVGLPLPPEFLKENPNVLNIEITESTNVKTGDYYEGGEFYDAEAWYEKHPVDIRIEDTPVSAEDIQARILLNQMEILAGLEIQQEVTALLLLETLGG